MWENLEWEVSYFQEKGDVILMGDLNARTGEMNDWIALDQTDNLPLPYDYTVDTENSARNSKDKIVNASGQLLIDACIATGM